MDVSPRFRQGNGMKSEGLVRLGRAVVAQRKRLGWATREAFEDNIDLTYRVLTDLENGNRKLGAKAYGQVERALGGSQEYRRHPRRRRTDRQRGPPPTARRYDDRGSDQCRSCCCCRCGSDGLAQSAATSAGRDRGRDMEPRARQGTAHRADRVPGQRHDAVRPIIELAVRLDRVRSDMPTGLPLEAADNIDVASDLADRAAAAMIGSRTFDHADETQVSRGSPGTRCCSCQGASATACRHSHRPRPTTVPGRPAAGKSHRRGRRAGERERVTILTVDDDGYLPATPLPTVVQLADVYDSFVDGAPNRQARDRIYRALAMHLDMLTAEFGPAGPGSGRLHQQIDDPTRTRRGRLHLPHSRRLPPQPQEGPIRPRPVLAVSDRRPPRLIGVEDLHPVSGLVHTDQIRPEAPLRIREARSHTQPGPRSRIRGGAPMSVDPDRYHHLAQLATNYSRTPSMTLTSRPRTANSSRHTNDPRSWPAGNR